jgi:hypothetical protein
MGLSYMYMWDRSMTGLSHATLPAPNQRRDIA